MARAPHRGAACDHINVLLGVAPTAAAVACAALGQNLPAFALVGFGYAATLYHSLIEAGSHLAMMALLLLVSAAAGAAYAWYDTVYPHVAAEAWLEVAAATVPVTLVLLLVFMCARCTAALGIAEGLVYLMVAGFFVGSATVVGGAPSGAGWGGVAVTALFFLSQTFFVVFVLHRPRGRGVHRGESTSVVHIITAAPEPVQFSGGQQGSSGGV